MPEITIDEYTRRACKSLGLPREKGGAIFGAILAAVLQEQERCQAIVLRILGQHGLHELAPQVIGGLEPELPYAEVPQRRDPTVARQVPPKSYIYNHDNG